MKRLIAAAVPLVAAFAVAAPAQAGTYDVHFCNSAGTVFDNKSWASLASAGIVVDPSCPGANQLIGIRVDAGTRSAAGAIAGLTFTSPAGTTITNFLLTRQLDYKNPVVSGTRPFFTLYQLGNVVFAGAGDYDDATRNRLNAQRSWYGYPANEAHLAKANVTRANFPALAAYRNDSRTMLLRVGCYRRNTAPCQVGPGGRIYNVFYGARVTVSDPTPPDSFSVEASGLLAGGQRDGSDPVTLSATDNAGIEKVEIFDVTNPAAPSLVGAENYDVGPTYEAGEQRTDKGATCSFRLAKPCPNLAGETIRPTSLQVGNRNLLVRVTDAGGNFADRGPFPVNVITPSDRGAANGSGASEPARVLLRFANTKRKRQTVRYYRKISVRGRLINAERQPDLRSRGAPAHARPAPGRERDRPQGPAHRLRRLLPRDGAREGVAPAPVRLARAGQRRPLLRQRLPDAEGARLRRAAGPPARRARRAQRAPDRPPEGRRAAPACRSSCRASCAAPAASRPSRTPPRAAAARSRAATRSARRARAGARSCSAPASAARPASRTRRASPAPSACGSAESPRAYRLTPPMLRRRTR